MVTLQDSSGNYARLLIEVKQDLSPVEARTTLADKLHLMRQLTGEAAALIIAPWLSPRTRDELRERGFGYLDLSGNMWLRLARPTVLIDKQGQQRNPRPRRRTGVAQLTGAKAARLVRFLADYQPPYQALDIALGADLSQAYVSRLLDALEDQGLITRQRRLIVDVDWAGLLMARADRAGLLKRNTASFWVAPQGPDEVLSRLRRSYETDDGAGQVAVTGSRAVEQLVPLSVGGQLMVYVSDLERASTTLPLLGPRPSGGDVVLLQPGDPVVFERVRVSEGVPHVALSQLALDLLSGTGRMPEEGEALLEYMQANEDQWRQAHNPSRVGA